MKLNEPSYRLALVSGATGAIGKAIALELAKLPEFGVLLLCRDRQKADRAVREIQTRTGNNNVRYQLVDLSSKSAINGLAALVAKPVHVLINNAATTPRLRQQTPEGIELQFATNVLGYFWMIRAFQDHLKAAPDSRVVNVASYWAGDLDLRDLEFNRRRYDNNLAYRQSKQADRMLTVAFAERLKEHGVTVNACHPGDVSSNLSNNLGFGGHESVIEAATTPVWLATAAEVAEKSGKYFERLKPQRCRFGENSQMVESLFDICLGY